MPNNQEPVEGASGKGSINGVVIVRCAGAVYGIDVEWVREIRSFTSATTIYGLPPFWTGITALRGHLYAVLDLQQLLFSGETTHANRPQLLYTAVHDLSVALLVEEVIVVRQTNAEAIMAAPALEKPYLLGMTADHITVLDLPRLFADLRLAAPVNQAIDAGA